MSPEQFEKVIALVMVIAGMVGLYYKVDWAGLLLFIGVIGVL